MSYLNRILLLISGIFVFSGVAAQNLELKNALILSGGKFETGAPPYQDRASVAVYSPSQKNYEFKDSIFVESVQDAVIKGDQAYLAAQDSIIRYDLNNFERVKNELFENLLWLSLNDSLILSGNRPGFVNPDPAYPLVNGWELPGLDSTLTVPTDSLYEGLGDATVHNNKVFVSHNMGKKNARSDSLGFLGVYNHQTAKFENNIHLDSTGAGIGRLFQHQGKIYGVCSEYNQLLEFDPGNQSTQFHDFNLNLPVGVFDGKLYGYTANRKVQAYDLAGNQYDTLGVSIPKVSGNFINAFNYDTLNKQIYVAQTNYQDTGFLAIYNENGNLDTSFQTHVSPKAIAFHYQETKGSGRKELENQPKFEATVYPNPAQNRVNLSIENDWKGPVTVKMVNNQGQTVIKNSYDRLKGSESYQWRIKNWESGLYFIEISNQNRQSSTKFIKQ